MMGCHFRGGRSRLEYPFCGRIFARERERFHAAMTPTSIVAYLSLFAGVAFLFVLVSLLLGRLLRAMCPRRKSSSPMSAASRPSARRAVQFDLRFYVVALVFIIFEVEVTLFFPPAAIFGKATQLMAPGVSRASRPRRTGCAGELGMASSCAGARRCAQQRIASRPADEAWRPDARHVGPGGDGRPGAVLRRHLGRLRLCLVAGRSRLGPRRRPGSPPRREKRQLEGGAALMDIRDIHQRLAARFGPAIERRQPRRPSIPGSRCRRRPCRRSAASCATSPSCDSTCCIASRGVDYFEPDAKKAAAVDWQPHVEVVYHLSSLVHRHRLVLKVMLPRWQDDVEGRLPEVPSVSDVWRTADWHEREVFDLSGVAFVGHPDLRRILLPEDWVGHPLRKDYQLPAEYHGIPGR